MLFITLGDPYSVNIELLLKTLSLQKSFAYPVVVLGNYSVWQSQFKTVEHDLVFENISSYEQAYENRLYFLSTNDKNYSTPASQWNDLERGNVSISPLNYLKEVSSKCTDQKMAVLTLPIHKHCSFLAGFDFPGHTEFFENIWQGRATMTLVAPQLSVGLVTNHIAISRLQDILTQELIELKIEKMIQGINKHTEEKLDCLYICGLNPHASDGGLFGTEEEEIIQPAVVSSQKKFPDIEIKGPVSADTVFYQALRDQKN